MIEPAKLDELLTKVLNGSILYHTGPEIWTVGLGYGSEPGCCGQFRRDGSCCGNAVEVQVETQVQIHLATCESEEIAALIVAAINAMPELVAVGRRVAELEARVALLSPYAALGLSVSEDWPDLSEIDGGDLFDMLEASGVIVKHPEPYDPDRHPFIEEIDPGDEWFSIPNRNEARAALKGPTT